MSHSVQLPNFHIFLIPSSSKVITVTSGTQSQGNTLDISPVPTDMGLSKLQGSSLSEAQFTPSLPPRLPFHHHLTKEPRHNGPLSLLPWEPHILSHIIKEHWAP